MLDNLKPYSRGRFSEKDIVGLSNAEIDVLERELDIVVQNELYDFLKIMGRASGSLLSDEIVFFRWDIKNFQKFVSLQLEMKQLLVETMGLEFVKNQGVFFFDVDYDNVMGSFLRTKSDFPYKVWRFVDNREIGFEDYWTCDGWSSSLTEALHREQKRMISGNYTKYKLVSNIDYLIND